MAVEVKTSHTDLMLIATEAHEATGGAPVEVRDGSRVVKIGPWPAKQLREQLAALLPLAMEHLKPPPRRDPSVARPEN